MYSKDILKLSIDDKKRGVWISTNKEVYTFKQNREDENKFDRPDIPSDFSGEFYNYDRRGDIENRIFFEKGKVSRYMNYCLIRVKIVI